MSKTHSYNRLDALKTLLRSNSSAKSTTGKTIQISIFTDDELNTFLQHGENATRTALNLTSIHEQTFNDLVVEYAFYTAILSKSLEEKGREMTYQDNGVSMTPPALADHMIAVAKMLSESWFKKVGYYKG